MNRVCLLTGASGKLGTAFCRQFSDIYAIAAVYCTGTLKVPTQFQQFVDPLLPHEALPENRHPVFGIRADLTNYSEIERIVELTLARFNKIDLIVNAAGTFRANDLLEPTQTKDACHDLFDLHVTAPVLLAGCVAGRFWQGREIENRQQNRDIVNVSSISGLNVYPNYRQSVYSAAKAALNYLTGHMSAEYRKIGVRVNAIAPTTFPSRVPTESVAQAIRGLDTAQVSGKVVVVDSEHVA